MRGDKRQTRPASYLIHEIDGQTNKPAPRRLDPLRFLTLEAGAALQSRGRVSRQRAGPAAVIRAEAISGVITLVIYYGRYNDRDSRQSIYNQSCAWDSRLS